MGISVNSIHDETVLNKRRIARSTVLLYVRMLVTVCVGLYTGRIVLNALGISDYGIYNVVGSIVMMLSSFNAAMTAASQRFMAYELGRADAEKLRSVFYTSVNIHIVIALAVFLLSETVGLWFVNTHLNIDAGRMTAANWVYQFSILTFMITVMSVPYNSCIVAHERMGVFASVSIFESILKLGTAICIASALVDRLVLYGGLLLFVSVLCNGCYVIYCKRYFAEYAGRKKNNRSLFKKMFLFAGWSTVGNLGFTFKDQIQNILLNVFFGSAINAARGIAGQIFGITSSFVSNFSMAINPQITKQYAKGNRYDYQYLVYDGARYSFCLLLLIAVPLLINTDYVLELWLGNVPPYTDRFVTLLLFAILLHTLSGTVTAAIQATGKVKLFQTGICMLMLSEMPAAWLMLKSGFPPYAVIYPTLTSYTAAIFFRFYVWRRIVPVVELRTYLSQVILRCLILFAVSYAVCGWIKGMFGDGFVAFAVTTLLSLCIVSFMIYILGLKRHERVAICREIRNRKFFSKISLTMNTTPILYILHEHGELSHFYAADLCTRRHGYAVCYREFNYRTQVKSIAVAWNKGKLRHVVANMLFPMQLLFGKRRKVVIGIAPFNRWLPVWSWILRRHEAYYFTSYTCWNGTKAVYNAHPSDTLIRIWRNFIGNRAKAVFAVSSKTKEELVRNGFVTEEKVIVVHHSHKEPPAPAEAVCKRNRFIYVGRMVPEKGIGELLDIFGRRPEALFTVVGSGSEAAEVSCKSEICANIVYAGYIADRVYLSELYREHCFLVLNSHRTAGWEELFGIAIIEAMSNGVVPLATDHTGPCEIITNEENGLLCPEGEIEVLIDRAMRMDEAKYRLLRHNAIRTAQEYRCEQVAARWNRLFED